MLILSRKQGDSIIQDIPNINSITITIMDNGKIGIDAEDCVKIIRENCLMIRLPEVIENVCFRHQFIVHRHGEHPCMLYSDMSCTILVEQGSSWFQSGCSVLKLDRYA